MTLLELRDLYNKHIKYGQENKEVFIDGNKMDNIVDLWTCANDKIEIVGNSTIEMFVKMEEY